MDSSDELLSRCEKSTGDAEMNAKTCLEASEEATRLFTAATQKFLEAKSALRRLRIFRWARLNREGHELIVKGKPLLDLSQKSLSNVEQLLGEAEQIHKKLENDFPISN